MSFQAYLDNIQAKTGKSPDDLKALAEQKRYLQNGVSFFTHFRELTLSVNT
ncbi:MAG: hypothetical protein RI950_273 [Bacteroidota bacterium]|jgi:hypothetical protein